MFYGNFAEKEKEEIELKDVNHEEFILYVIYPSYKPINIDSYRFVLELVDRFQMKCALDYVEEYVIRTKKLSTLQKLVMADEFRLEMLKMHCLKLYKTLKEIKTLESLPEFMAFSADTKSAFCLRMMQLIE
ncbi:hypothetical protein PFISCL1PPCAC_20947 [Pristionchus fissidentatus]|uniref:BTB domain-containing protein n=1 Tax=Pristionchus fissidentatus TaxID=1538716 RepID=A0AAV5WGE1_9BILA|nr:hypothetical protein PFISCL1PPCAC_20947 [Pristionchus fissidentatus]